MRARHEDIRKPVKRSDGQIYGSLKGAAEANGVCTASIRRAVQLGSRCHGFQFAFVGHDFLAIPERKERDPATIRKKPLMRSDGQLFASIKEAAAAVDVSPSALIHAMKSQRPTQDGYFYWRLNSDMTVPASVREAVQEASRKRLWLDPPEVSEKARRNMSEAARRRSTPEWRRVASERCKNKRPVELSDGRKFASVRAAAAALGVTRNALDGALARNGTCRGLKALYL